MTSNGSNAVRQVLVYLHAAGYRPLPNALWPSGVVGAFGNSEGDAVAVLDGYPLGLELRPLERGIADAAHRLCVGVPGFLLSRGPELPGHRYGRVYRL